MQTGAATQRVSGTHGRDQRAGGKFRMKRPDEIWIVCCTTMGRLYMKSSDNRAWEGEYGQRTCHAVDGKAWTVDEESSNQSASISQSSRVNVVCRTFWLWWNRFYSIDDGHSTPFRRTFAVFSLSFSHSLSVSLFHARPCSSSGWRVHRRARPFSYTLLSWIAGRKRNPQLVWIRFTQHLSIEVGISRCWLSPPPPWGLAAPREIGRFRPGCKISLTNFNFLGTFWGTSPLSRFPVSADRQTGTRFARVDPWIHPARLVSYQPV